MFGPAERVTLCAKSIEVMSSVHPYRVTACVNVGPVRSAELITSFT